MTDVAAYLESGELPDDPAVLAKLYQEMIGEEATAKSVEVEESTSAATSAVEAKAEKEPDGIATKDGKHIISYDVLKSARQQRQDAVKIADDLRAEIERMKNSPAQQDLVATGVMTDEQLADLKEFFPEQYDAIVAQQANSVAYQQKLSQFEQADRRRNIDEQNKISLNVQEEIDNNPVLSDWQRNDPEAFEYCVQQDNLLRDNPKTANLSLSERFSKAVAIASQVYDSPIKLAPAKTQAQATVKARPIINSLSDVPGGEPVEASEQQQLESMSGVQIGNMFLGKSQEQINAILARMG